MSHTPGPWTIDEEGTLRGRFGLIKPYIGSIRDDHNDEETAANARLIVAAPELLQALRCALADLEGSLADYEEHDWDARVKSIKEARLAISKATGEKFHQTTPFGKY